MLDKINPCSSYHAMARQAFSKNLTRGQQLGAVILTILASPFLIIGGIATFGTVVNFFKNRNIILLSKDDDKTAKATNDVAKNTLLIPDDNQVIEAKKKDLKSILAREDRDKDFIFNFAVEHLFQLSLISDLSDCEEEIQKIKDYYSPGDKGAVGVPRHELDQFNKFLKQLGLESEEEIIDLTRPPNPYATRLRLMKPIKS